MFIFKPVVSSEFEMVMDPYLCLKYFMMQEQYPSLLLQQASGILTVTVNRPQALNAINREVMGSLHDVFQDLKTDVSVKGVIITGAGDRAFIAGADIKDFSFEGEASKQNGTFGHEVFNMIEGSRKPVVAAINGFALGGGCELAMACHLRVATEHAKFGQPEINLGLIPGYGGTQRLPQLVGKAKALELLLTADIIDATEAYRLGLVNQVVPAGEHLSTATAMLGKIINKAPIAAGKIIELVNLHYHDFEQGLKKEIESFAACFQTEDAREGVAAFIEKRKPNFKGV